MERNLSPPHASHGCPRSGCCQQITASRRQEALVLSAQRCCAAEVLQDDVAALQREMRRQVAELGEVRAAAARSTGTLAALGGVKTRMEAACSTLKARRPPRAPPTSSIAMPVRGQPDPHRFPSGRWREALRSIQTHDEGASRS